MLNTARCVPGFNPLRKAYICFLDNAALRSMTVHFLKECFQFLLHFFRQLLTLMEWTLLRNWKPSLACISSLIRYDLVIPFLPPFSIIVELSWKRPLKAVQTNSLAVSMETYSRPCCSEPQPAWFWMSARTGHPSPLWATCPSALSPLLWKNFPPNLSCPSPFWNLLSPQLFWKDSHNVSSTVVCCGLSTLLQCSGSAMWWWCFWGETALRGCPPLLERSLVFHTLLSVILNFLNLINICYEYCSEKVWYCR